MTDKEALLEALEALHYCEALNRDADERKMQAITVIRKLWTEHAMREVQRLGQEIEPDDIASILACRDMLDAQPVPQRTWVGLTKEEIAEFDTWHDNREEEVGWVNPSEIVAYIDAKLKEKNA